MLALACGRASESEKEPSSASDEGSENDESEYEREQVQLQPAENEIEGDFESVGLSLIGSDRCIDLCPLVASLIQLENLTASSHLGCSVKPGI